MHSHAQEHRPHYCSIPPLLRSYVQSFCSLDFSPLSVTTTLRFKFKPLIFPNRCLSWCYRLKSLSRKNIRVSNMFALLFPQKIPPELLFNYMFVMQTLGFIYYSPLPKNMCPKTVLKNTRANKTCFPVSLTGDLANVWPRVVPQDTTLPTMNSHHRKMGNEITIYSIWNSVCWGSLSLKNMKSQITLKWAQPPEVMMKLHETSRNHVSDESSSCNPAMLFKHHRQRE